MKTQRTFHKIFSSLVLISFLVSCNSKPKVTESKATAAPGHGSVPTVETGPEVYVAPVKLVRVKNYNQYNFSLEKLTGVDRTTHTELFEALKGSLPADNDLEGLTPFNLIAMTRLADAYCTSYVYTKLPANLFSPFNAETVMSLMTSTFLDRAPQDQPDYYQTLETELTNIFNNDDGEGGKLFPSPNPTTLNKDLTVAACVAILSSPYITILE